MEDLTLRIYAIETEENGTNISNEDFINLAEEKGWIYANLQLFQDDFNKGIFCTSSSKVRFIYV